MSQLFGILLFAFLMSITAWGLFLDFKNPFKPQKDPRLCERCIHLSKKFPDGNEMYNRYICSVDKEKVKGYDISPEYCHDFEERSTNDPHMDT